MNRLIHVALLLGLAAAPGLANLSLYQGVFGADDQVQLFTFQTLTTESVTIQTYGYAGGTVSATVIPAGGFAPSAFLFDSSGNEIGTLPTGTSSQVGQDPVTMNYDDLYYQAPFAAGTYTLALVVYGNTPVDTFLADGFVEDGNPGFTCASFGIPGTFCDETTALGTSRTGDFAISITGADNTTAVPEPSYRGWLLVSGALLALLRFRTRFVTR
jgi:hypothetical protein